MAWLAQVYTPFSGAIKNSELSLVMNALGGRREEGKRGDEGGRVWFIQTELMLHVKVRFWFRYTSMGTSSSDVTLLIVELSVVVKEDAENTHDNHNVSGSHDSHMTTIMSPTYKVHKGGPHIRTIGIGSHTGVIPSSIT